MIALFLKDSKCLLWSLWFSLFTLGLVEVPAATTSGTPVAWGDNTFMQTNIPPGLTSVVAIAAGSYFNLAIKNDGRLVGWGMNSSGQTNVPAGVNYVAVAGGELHGVALKANGTVTAWGDNLAGQTNTAGLSAVKAIAAGAYHNLALHSNGTVSAWGESSYGKTTPPPFLSGVKAVAAGANHSLALRSNGTLVAWGLGSSGQTNVPGGSSYTAIAAGNDFSMALRNDGRVTNWGNLHAGTLVPPPLLSGVAAIAAGGTHCLALRSNGTVVCWGDNSGGQTNVPAGLAHVIALAGGAQHSLIVRVIPPVITSQPQSQIAIAGTNVTFTVGVSGSVPLHYQWRKQDTAIPGATNFSYTINNVQPTNSGSYTVVVTNSAGSVTSAVATLTVNLSPMITVQPEGTNVGVGGTARFSVQATGSAPLRYQWRREGINILNATNSSLNITNVQSTHAGNYTVVVTNNYGAVTSAVAVLIVHNLPTILGQPQSQTVIAGSSVSFSVSAVDATIYQWRKNGVDIPGATNPLYTINGAQTGDAGSYLVVVGNNYGSVTSMTAVLTVSTAAGPSSTLVVAWGESNVWNGVTNVNVTPPPSLSNVVAIAVGRLHSLALKGDGTVVGWGDNTYGQAAPPSGLSGVSSIAAGWYHSLARKSDGTVIAWGRNNVEQTNVPPDATNVMAISAGSYHSLALRTDGRIVGWGLNNFGQRSPPGITSATAMAAGLDFSLAVLSDSTVVGFGLNDFGQWRIPAGLSNVMAVAAGDYHSLALKRDGTVIAWGRNDHQQTNVPPALANVTAIAAGANHCLALKRDGTVEGWGQDNFFQNVPPPGLNGVFAIAAGGDRSLALKRKLLRMLATHRQPDGRIRLRISNADGSPVEADRLNTVGIYATTNLALNVTLWTRLTNSISLLGGVLETEEPGDLPLRFYITVD